MTVETVWPKGARRSSREVSPATGLPERTGSRIGQGTGGGAHQCEGPPLVGPTWACGARKRGRGAEPLRRAAACTKKRTKLLHGCRGHERIVAIFFQHIRQLSVIRLHIQWPHPIDLWVRRREWLDAILEIVEHAQHHPAHVDDCHVAAAEVLLRPIEDIAHAFIHGLILRRNKRNPGKRELALLVAV